MRKYKVKSYIACPYCGYEESITEVWCYRDKQCTEISRVEIQGRNFWGKRGDEACCPRCAKEFKL